MRFNWHKQKNVTLEEGEYFCRKCSGSGVVPRSNASNKVVGNLICDKCLGEGKLDWIEKAVGKRQPLIDIEVEELTLKKRRRQLKGEWTIEIG